MQPDCLIDFGTRPRPIGPKADQFLHVGIGRHHLPAARDDRQIGGIGRFRHSAGDRFEDVDGGIASALRDRPLHHHMAVQDAAHRVRDRLIMVIAVDQHRENAGDGPCADPGAGTLQQLRQFGEDGRRVALGGRRLAGGQADLALGHGKARHRIHQAQHVTVLVAEIFRDREREVRGLAAHQRGLV